jgi:23S rRNA (guanosine2251-2'-O)-methyltransferase
MQKLTMDDLQRVSIPEYKDQEKLPVVVVLDNVRSMHNVGSVFRTGDGFSIEKLYLVLPSR